MTSSFLFTDEQDAFRDSVRRYARGLLYDSYHERATSDEFPRDIYERLGKDGYLGLTVSEEFGGQGADLMTLGIASEEFAYADFNVSYFVFNSAIAGSMYETKLQPDVREAWLPKIVSGERVPGLALTEPGGGSDAAAMRTRAERVEGGWRLHGEKTSVSLSPSADVVTVFAKTDPDAGARGVSAFFVRQDDPTISHQRFADPGFRPIGRGSIALDGTFVPDSHVVGDIGRGFHLVMGEFDFTRSVLGLMAIGAAERVLDMTVEYVKEREAFGRPIARFEGVSFPIAEYATKLEAARWLCYRAIALREAGRPHTKEAAMIKWWVPELATRCVHDCIVLHGHVGWSEEMPLQQLYRDVSSLEIGDGTPQIQKLVVAREILGRGYLPYDVR
ncbi:acyl-CoA dehydrogenase [Nitriliruptoraceae bacterium ZYF776]|nr:acyl-CoA dehydrogenase [Profundirhabdus halotolerans]